MEKTYYCDPSKNTECSKKYCMYNPYAKNLLCDRTNGPECAILDELNRPMEAEPLSIEMVHQRLCQESDGGQS